MIGGARALIDLSALRHNLEQVRLKAPRSQIMAAVKANAYGHGLLRVARALEGADALAVARIDEALLLRQGGINRPIVVLEGVFTAEQLAVAQANDVAVVVHHAWQLELLRGAHCSPAIKVWIKVDSGMHRLGFLPAEVHSAWNALHDLSCVADDIGLMTHLASADLPDDPTTNHQLSVFADACAGLPGPRSIANSAGILQWPQTQSQWVRPGLMLYGASPFADSTATSWNLQPVMQFVTELIAVKPLNKDDAVGYNGTWRAPSNTLIGIAAVGYGDGFPRHARTGTPVLVGGRRVSLVGRVSMDMIAVDLGADAHEKVGTPVVLWGDDALPVEEVARWADTISYDLLCGIAGRVEVVEF